MKKDKTPLKISVKTHANGYSLDVTGKTGYHEEYFYHDLDSLLAGFYVRVALRHRDTMDQEDIDQLMIIALNYERCKAGIQEEYAKYRKERNHQARADAIREINAEIAEERRQQHDAQLRTPKHHVNVNVTERTLASLDVELRHTSLTNRMVRSACRAIGELAGAPPNPYATLADVAAWDKDDLLSVKNIGISFVGKLNVALMEYDMHLGMDIAALRQQIEERKKSHE